MCRAEQVRGIVTGDIWQEVSATGDFVPTANSARAANSNLWSAKVKQIFEL